MRILLKSIWKSILFFIISIILLLPSELFGQLLVSNSYTAAQLVDFLVGSGVYVSNITSYGSINARGRFSNGNTTNIGLKNGVILSTGRVQDAPGPNNVGNKSTNNGYGSDALLATLVNQTIYDASTLEFDFVPNSDTIKFRYVFASEEYAEYVNSYNDVFGFFVSGPNPSGGSYVNDNIALIPNTSVPVSINNVNNGRWNAGPCTNCQYYIINNQNTIQYDGFTTVLTAVIRVVPCQTYHIKIAIGDAGDAKYDSGVFLEENSFTSNTITTKVTFSNPSITNGAAEDCNNATITFSLPNTKTTDFLIRFLKTGTAINGVDYVAIPDSVIIPAGNRSASLDIIPYMDSLNEPTEYVTLRYLNTLCIQTITDSVQVLILNKLPFKARFRGDTTICYGQADTIFVQADGGITPYTFTWSNTNSNIPGMKVKPLTTTNYIASVLDLCNTIYRDTITITVNPTPVADFSINDSDQCHSGNHFIFSNTTSINPYRAITHYWTFGDSRSSTSLSPDHDYIIPSSYQVSLLSTSSDGCSSLVSKNVHVYPNPVAGLIINDTTQCHSGNSFNFTNSSTITNGNLNYYWQFGDKTTSGNESPTHHYNYPDTFAVNMKALSDKGCMDSIQRKVYVFPMPDADFIINDSTQCLRGNGFYFANYSLISYGTLTYEWDFGDSSFSNITSPVHSYSVIDTPEVKMYAISDQFCRDSLKKTVYIFASPTASFTVQDSLECLSGNNFITSNNSNIPIGNLSYLWDFGDQSTSSKIAPNHSYLRFDTFKIRLIVTSSLGCVDSTARLVIVNPMPDASFLLNDSAQCLSGNSFVFSDHSSIHYGSLNYLWNFGDGNFSVLPSPSHSYANDDTFRIRYLVTSGNGCSDSAFLTGIVYPMPVAAFTVNDSIQCFSNNSFNYNNLSTIPWGNLNFHWDFGDSSFSTQTNTNHSYLKFNTYNVKLLTISNMGCRDSVIHPVIVDEVPGASFRISDTALCLKYNAFKFNNLSVINSSSLSYQWSFGDGSMSTDTNPLHSYPVNDTFKIRLLAVSIKGCTDSAFATAYVWATPDAGYRIYDSSQCLKRNNFVFINQSTIPLGSMTYRWEFGDKDTSSAVNPVHHYITADTFAVHCIATSNMKCKDTASRKTIVHSHSEPTASFIINDSAQCISGNNFLFTNTSTISSGTISQVWDFGDTNISNAFSPVHRYFNYDTFRAKLLVISDYGCKDSIYKTVIISPMPKADFTFPLNEQCLNINSFSFYDRSGIIYGLVNRFAWDFGDGKTSVLQNPAHIFKTYDTFNVRLVAFSSEGCPDTSIKQAIVHPKPLTDFIINDSTQCLKGNHFIFTNTTSISSGSLNYRWNFGDGNTSTGINATHNYLLYDTFPVTLLAISGLGCRDSMIKNAIVYPVPKAKFSIDDSSQCLTGNLFKMTNQSTNVYGNLSYLWNFGDGNLSNQKEPDHSYLYNDTFPVILQVITGDGCTDSMSKSIIVHPMPAADFSINDNAQCLKGNRFELNNISVIPWDQLSGYSWAFGDGNYSTQKDNIHSYSNDRNYTIKMVVTSNYNCTDSMFRLVTVHPMPVARFSHTFSCLEDTTYFNDLSVINNPGIINLWQWDFGNGDYDITENPNTIFSAPGLYTVQLVVTSDKLCTDSTTRLIRVNPHVDAGVIDRVTVDNDEAILIEWIKPVSGIPEKYIVERSLDGMYYFPIVSLPQYQFSYTDINVFPDLKSYIYRIKVIDSCGYESPFSNTGKNILLTGNVSGLNPQLTWTRYVTWPAGVKEYILQVWNKEAGSFQLVANTGTDTFYDDPDTRLNQKEYCYKVTAFRDDGIESQSNTVCLPAEFNLWVPDAFSPNNDEYNPLFEIRGTYVLSFHIEIYSRWGERLFISDEIAKSWDGTYHGTPCPPGYYYYHIKSNGPEGQGKNVSGMVFLLR